MNGLGIFLVILRTVHNTFGTCRATTDRQRGKDRWWQISSPSLPVVMMVMMISSDDLYFKEGVVSNYDSCQRFEHCDNAEDNRAEVLWQQGYLWTWWFFLSQLTALKTFEKTHSKCLEKLETSTYGHQCCCYVHLCQRWYSCMFTYVKDDTHKSFDQKINSQGGFHYGLPGPPGIEITKRPHILFTIMETDIQSSLLFESIATFSWSFLWIALWIKTIRPPSKINKWLIWPNIRMSRKKNKF